MAPSMHEPNSRPGGGLLGAQQTLEELNIRVTYRTAGILVAIAECPDLTNRALARAVGVRDEGQMSKLLKRLERAGVIYNSSPRSSKTGPNAWRLTQLGNDAATAIRVLRAGIRSAARSPRATVRRGTQA